MAVASRSACQTLILPISIWGCEVGVEQDEQESFMTVPQRLPSRISVALATEKTTETRQHVAEAASGADPADGDPRAPASSAITTGADAGMPKISRLPASSPGRGPRTAPRL
jgi:hypothetical protein